MTAIVFDLPALHMAILNRSVHRYQTIMTSDTKSQFVSPSRNSFCDYNVQLRTNVPSHLLQTLPQHRN